MSLSSIRDFVNYTNTTQIHKAIVLLIVACLGIGFGVGFSTSMDAAREDADADYARRLNIFTQFQMNITSRFTRASALSATIASFAMGHAKTPVNMSIADPILRIKDRQFEEEVYQRICREIHIDGVFSLVLAPGGAISQWYHANKCARAPSRSKRFRRARGTTSPLFVAKFWSDSTLKDDDDNDTNNNGGRDNDDPSVAMAALNDAYVRRMLTVVDEGREIASKLRKARKHGEELADGDKSTEKGSVATTLSRNTTLLHIAILSHNEGAPPPFDLIRSIVSEEKGSAVSAHENTLVAAFNLLNACSQHQMRAADTMNRIIKSTNATNSSLASSSSFDFAFSLHSGRVSALIANGLVMCHGEAVLTGKNLLNMAIEAANGSTPSAIFSKHAAEAFGKLSEVTAFSGLCLLLNPIDFSGYDCEAVDVIASVSTTLGVAQTASAAAAATTKAASSSSGAAVATTATKSSCSLGTLTAAANDDQHHNRIVYRLWHPPQWRRKQQERR